MSDYPC